MDSNKIRDLVTKDSGIGILSLGQSHEGFYQLEYSNWDSVFWTETLVFSHWNSVIGIQSLGFSHWDSAIEIQSLGLTNWDSVTGID